MTATPRSLPAATRLLERYAELAGQLAVVEACRAEEIAKANALADAEVAPIAKELSDITAVLEPWWFNTGTSLASDGRKSIELGGCMIGSRQSRPRLEHSFQSDDAAIEALRSMGRPLKLTTRIKYSLDRAAIVKLLGAGNKLSQDLSKLGFAVGQSETFFIQRAEQAGTLKP